MANIRAVKLDVSRGDAFPLGIKIVNQSIHFSVAVQDATQCKLNLYRKGEIGACYVIEMGEYRIGDVFSVAIRDLPKEEFEYTYEVDGKEFVDPCAKAIAGRGTWGHRLSLQEKRMVRGVLPMESYHWKQDVKLMIPFEDMILYRLHVRGFTNHPSSKVSHKGTFLGIKEKIQYLKKLGINAVELMPVYDFYEVIEKSSRRPGQYSYVTAHSDGIGQFLEEENVKINYWGYTDTAYYYAPKAAYAATDDPIHELKKMVNTLHANGIEVILEMHFDAEVTQTYIIECLRHWVQEYHIDGFRLNHNVNLAVIGSDPYLSETKLLGTSWNTYEMYHDRKPNYKNIAEYNDEFMNNVRRYLKGDEGQVNAFTMNFKRNPAKCARINYITNTNGFTLMDLYSYDVKHNDDNGEDNRDGTEYNFSWNCGLEGKTRRKKIATLRRKQIRNAFVSLLFSQGTPMILAGDEFGNSQGGNNNAYCQDNEVTWLNWNQLKSNEDIHDFVQMLIKIRKEHPILHTEEELRVMDYLSCGYPDISFHGTRAWFPDYSNYSRVLGIMLCGRYAKISRFEEDCYFYFAYNMHWIHHEFDLPILPPDDVWQILIDTTEGVLEDQPERFGILEQTIDVKPRSILVLKSIKRTEVKFEAVEEQETEQDEKPITE